MSWRIITESLQQLLNGKSLVDKGSSYRQWVKAVSNYAIDNIGELVYWQEVMEGYSDIHTKNQISYKHISLSPEQTDILLHQSNQGYHTEINDLLLSALSIALGHTFGQKHNHITLEGHGRENINDQLDVSQTVGWFTTSYPVILNQKEDIVDTIISTKEMLRKIPNKGIGFGAFKQLGEIDVDLPTISFNYLGQFDNTSQQDDIEAWQILGEDSGQQSSDENNFGTSLNISGMVQNKVLRLNITSTLSAKQSQRFEISFKKALTSVINCTHAAFLLG